MRVQSEHFSGYARVLGELRQRRLVYPCFCTRAEIAASVAAPHGPEGTVIYPGTCRGLDRGLAAARCAAGEPHAWRLDITRALAVIGSDLSYEEIGQGSIRCDPAGCGDVVLARKDVPASYHLCVTHDDALQEVDLVTRGEDLRPATSVHRVLQTLMGWAAPRYAHHKLILDADGKRLAKRDHSRTLHDLRQNGATADDIRKLLQL